MTKGLSIRVNVKLKNDFRSFCKKRGFPMAKKINLLAQYIVETGTIPFPINEYLTYTDGDTTTTAFYMSPELRESFAITCKKFGLPMGLLIRNYMDYCLTNDCLPI